MKKFWSKSCTLALAFIMLCSAFAGVPLQMVTATDGTGTTEDLLVVDENLTVTPGDGGADDIIRQNGQPNGIKYVDYGFDQTAAVNGESNQMILRQTLVSNWNRRIMTDGFSTTQDGKINVEMRFQVQADSYDGTVPSASMIFAWLGSSNLFVQPPSSQNLLSEENRDVWHTVVYTIDPEAKTVTGTLDNIQFCQQFL